MTFLLLIPAALSLLVLGAHYLRNGWLPWVVVSVAMIPAMLIPRRWIKRLIQIYLAIGVLEWLRTMVVLAQARRDAGEDFMRMLIILGAVAGVTLTSVLLLEVRRVRRYYS